MKMQFGWFITHFIYESHNAAMTLKWKSISVNPFWFELWNRFASIVDNHGVVADSSFTVFKNHLNGSSLTGDLTRVHFHSLNNSITHRSAVDLFWQVRIPWFHINKKKTCPEVYVPHFTVKKHFVFGSSQPEQSQKGCPAHLCWLTCITKTPPP